MQSELKNQYKPTQATNDIFRKAIAIHNNTIKFKAI
jgi:hypothetical protein